MNHVLHLGIYSSNSPVQTDVGNSNKEGGKKNKHHHVFSFPIG